MAKRKRLSPATQEYLDDTPRAGTSGASSASLNTRLSEPPIAQVTREAATAAALEEVSREISSAREEGRLVQDLPLNAIERNYLIRDRVVVNDEEMASLKSSLSERGQQTPIEVVDLGQGRYGLISGWRRLSALEALFHETGAAKFSTVKALLRKPETAGDAYTAMVEENEIRVGLSPFERAHIVAKAVEKGIFPDDRAALRALFGSASRSKRSKIGTFLRIVAAFEGDIKFPGAIAERLGLNMAKALDQDPGFAKTLRDALRNKPVETPDAEQVLIHRIVHASLKQVTGQGTHPSPLAKPPPLQITRKGQKMTLSGAAVTPELESALRDWARTQGL